MSKQKIIALLLCSFICLVLRAQNRDDSSYMQAVAVYKHTAGANMHLYNGSGYIDYDHRIKGSPFFSESYFTTSSIVYDGILYNNVQLFYDLVHDNVVIKNYNDTALLLVQQKIGAFDLLGHHFINLQAANSTTAIKDSGFYDVLYNGNAKLFAKRKKTITEKISTTYSESSFTEKDAYYILNNSTLYAVNDKSSVLDALKDKKADVSKFLHQSKIKFRRNPEAAMLKMVIYYDGLNNAK